MGTEATTPIAAAARCDKEAMGSKKPGMARMMLGPGDKAEKVAVTLADARIWRRNPG
jgi:hypothetical protein